jgi:S-adenosylmethionine/arginine decarboxylase-like enzyme
MSHIAPHILRQRMYLEGEYSEDLQIDDIFLKKYLIELSNVLDMTVIFGPLIMRQAEKIYPKHAGFECIMIWAESGVSLYTWEDGKFFTVDIYSCKKFSVEEAIELTRTYFAVKQLEWKEV